MAAHTQAVDDVVVIGASLAGLFAAAAASGSGRRVTVVERDILPSAVAPRPGVAQSEQPHVFLYRGLLAVEALLPGVRAELLALGAVPFNTGNLPWLSEQGWLPLGHQGFEILSLTRPLFEHVVLERVRALPGVRFVDGVKVAGLSRPNPQTSTWQVELGDGTRLRADLVVDASGRGTRLPKWLADMKIDVPAPTEVDAKVGYAARMYAARPDEVYPGVVVMSSPTTLRGGLALRVEDDRFLVLASGYGDRRPPRDTEGFIDFLGALIDPALADLVADREPLGEVLVHRRTGNRRHHYEEAETWPDGLLAMGDAFCSFNPVYGQGVTIAALEAGLLRKALDGGLGAAPGDARRLMRRFAKAVALPWAIASGADTRYPTTSQRQGRAQAALGWWSRELGGLGVHGDERAAYTLERVYHLMGSPALLFHPALVGSAVVARLRGSRRRAHLLAPRPAGLTPGPAGAAVGSAAPAREARQAR